MFNDYTTTMMEDYYIDHYKDKQKVTLSNLLFDEFTVEEYQDEIKNILIEHITKI